MVEINDGGHGRFIGSTRQLLHIGARSVGGWLALLVILTLIPLAGGPAAAQNTDSTMPSISDEPSDRAQAHYERAQLLESWGMWEKALEEYRRVLELTDYGPHRSSSHYEIGFCLFKLERYQEALDALNQIKPEDLPDPSLQERIESAREKILKAMREHSQGTQDRP
ncbi:MAG: CDC27 family protein [Deltaproteobacteria bacterium]|nr:CDC27 family protein [Deltaproteobacteria bacterium]